MGESGLGDVGSFIVLGNAVGSEEDGLPLGSVVVGDSGLGGVGSSIVFGNAVGSKENGLPVGSVVGFGVGVIVGTVGQDCFQDE